MSPITAPIPHAFSSASFPRAAGGRAADRHQGGRRSVVIRIARRGRIVVVARPIRATQAHACIAEILAGKSVLKVIVVSGRMVNFVVK